MAIERKEAITFKGNPLTLIGDEITVGAEAPDFQVLANDLKPFQLSDTQGKTRVISVVPSLDTPVCDAQTRKFNEAAAKLTDVIVLTISMDLPFAQTRWCGAAGIDKVKCYSDHRDASFGTHYGVLIKELRLDSRAVFVIDKQGIVRYVEYVKEITNPPNYDAVIEVAKKLSM